MENKFKILQWHNKNLVNFYLPIINFAVNVEWTAGAHFLLGPPPPPHTYSIKLLLILIQIKHGKQVIMSVDFPVAVNILTFLL